jgi:hypothetical protein
VLLPKEHAPAFLPGALPRAFIHQRLMFRSVQFRCDK